MTAQHYLALAGACVALACASGGAGGTAGGTSGASTPEGVSPAEASAPAVGGPAMIATLNAVSSRIYGTIRLEPTGKADELRAKISIRGAALNQQLPWEIRVGQCGEGGRQLGAQAAFRLISARSDGTGDLTATVPVSLSAGQTYSVNVLASPPIATASSPVGC